MAFGRKLSVLQWGFTGDDRRGQRGSTGGIGARIMAGIGDSRHNANVVIAQDEASKMALSKPHASACWPRRYILGMIEGGSGLGEPSKAVLSLPVYAHLRKLHVQSVRSRAHCSGPSLSRLSGFALWATLFQRARRFSRGKACLETDNRASAKWQIR
jgi:hypothetical protein